MDNANAVFESVIMDPSWKGTLF